MAEVFGRKYTLSVTTEPTLIKTHTVTSLPDYIVDTRTQEDKLAELQKVDLRQVVDYITVTGQTTTITDPIQIIADIKYAGGTQTVSRNNSTIKLYNLSPETRALFKQDSAIVLNAGYEQNDELPLVFVGQVASVTNKKTNNGMETKLVCVDGGNVYKNVSYVKGFAKGHTYQFVIDQLVKTFGANGIPLGAISEKINENTTTTRISTPLLKPLYTEGKLTEVMTQVCEAIDYVWYILLGKIYVQPRELDRYKEVLNIDSNQVIGTIELSDTNKPRQANDKSKSKVGIEFDTYLNGNITPAVTVTNSVTGSTLQGDYKVTKVKHQLNWHDGPWQTTVETQGV